MTDNSDWFKSDIATFGDRLTGAREAAGLSVKELADRLGVSARSLSSWESDLSEPRGSRAPLLAGMLGVSLTWLMNGEGPGIDAPETDTDGAEALIAETRQIRREITRLGQHMELLEARMKRVLASHK